MPDEKRTEEPSLEAYAQGLPNSLEAEQSVLGCVLIDPELLSDIMEKIRSPQVFYTRQHRELYSLMIRMFSESKPIDYVTLLDEARGEEIFENEGTAKNYLLHLMEAVPTTANLPQYCDILLEKYYMRGLLTAATDIASAVRQEEGSASELLDAAEQKIYDIRQGRQTSELQPIGDVIIGVYDSIYEMNQRDDSRITGLASGFTQLDLMLSGLNKTDLILVAARPGMGKSAFALNIAANVGMKHPDLDIAIFSLEMSNPQLVTRMLCSDALIPSDKMRTGHLEKEEWQKLAVTAQRLSGTHIYMDDTAGITVAEMRTKLRRLKLETGKLDMVVIDYLQLMNYTGRAENRTQIVAEITRALKMLARELAVPIVLLSQLSRAPEQRPISERRPRMSDLRESGAIEQDADVIIMLYRPAVYDPEAGNEAYAIIAKHRNGPTGDIQLVWDGAHASFMSVAYREE